MKEASCNVMRHAYDGREVMWWIATRPWMPSGVRLRSFATSSCSFSRPTSCVEASDDFFRVTPTLLQKLAELTGSLDQIGTRGLFGVYVVGVA